MRQPDQILARQTFDFGVYEQTYRQRRPTFSVAVRLTHFGHRIEHTGLVVQCAFGADDSALPSVNVVAEASAQGDGGTGPFVAPVGIAEREIDEFRLIGGDGKPNLGDVGGVQPGQRFAGSHVLTDIDLPAADPPGEGCVKLAVRV